MTRLAWKEMREQWPYVLSALLVPLILFPDHRRTDPARTKWPDAVGPDLWLLFVVFAGWGATRLPYERAPGRLTLFTIPARSGMIWLAKVAPGALTAVAATLWAMRLGQSAVSHPWDVAEIQPRMLLTAGCLLLTYAVAFLLSDSFGAAISGLLAIPVGLFIGQAAQFPDRNWLGGDPERKLWAAALLFLVVPLAWRWLGGGPQASIGRRVLAAAMSAALIAQPVAVSFGENSGWILISNSSGTWGVATPMFEGLSTFRKGGRVAFQQDGYDREIGFPGRRRADRLWTARTDGSERVRIPVSGMLAALGWTDAGRLLFQWQPDPRSEVRWMLWRPATKTLSEVPGFRLPASEAAFPLLHGFRMDGGTRVAFFRPSVRALMPNIAPMDLYLLDTSTGRTRLLWPAAPSGELRWYDGRLFVSVDDKVMSLSPYGGPPRPEVASRAVVEHMQ